MIHANGQPVVLDPKAAHWVDIYSMMWQSMHNKRIISEYVKNCPLWTEIKRRIGSSETHCGVHDWEAFTYSDRPAYFNRISCTLISTSLAYAYYEIPHSVNLVFNIHDGEEVDNIRCSLSVPAYLLGADQATCKTWLDKLRDQTIESHKLRDIDTLNKIADKYGITWEYKTNV